MVYFEEPFWVNRDRKEPVAITNSERFGFGIRKYYEDENGDLKPGRKGINFKQEEALEIIGTIVRVALANEVIDFNELGEYLDR